MTSDDDSIPEGITLIDTHDDSYIEDDAFSLALYSRVQNVIDTDEDSHSQTPSNATEHSSPHSPHEPALSPTFVSRIQEQLKQSCHQPHTTDPSTTIQFLNQAEELLENHYDRILSNEALLDAKLIENTPLSNTNTTLHDKKIHTIPYPILKNNLEHLVREIIQQYRVFFEKEKDIIDMAKRCDHLKTWVQHTKEVFQENQVNLPKHEQGEHNKKIEHMISKTNWAQAFETIKKTWVPLSENRTVIQELHKIIGGPTGCRICFNQQVQTVLVPCGHVLCETCAQEVDHCPFCHSSFYAKQNIYFM